MKVLSFHINPGITLCQKQYVCKEECLTAILAVIEALAFGYKTRSWMGVTEPIKEP